MPIIKDQQLSDNSWTFVSDDAALNDGNITVSAQRWLADKAQLAKHNGLLGIRLEPSDAVDTIAGDLASFALIELHFPVFTDGRSFSQARLLRSRYGYQGEIRAVGRFMADQVFYLNRVGVDAFELENPSELKVALSAVNDISVRYQAAVN